MEEKEFLDEKVTEILALMNKICKENPTRRSEELQNELNTLGDALDAYIVEYGEILKGEQFETRRLLAYENEENPVVISSTAYYMQYNSETEKEEEESSDVWRYYDVKGEPDDTYEMYENFFPANDNVKQYLETEHIKFDREAIEQILEKYKSKLASKESELMDLKQEEKTITEAEKLIDKQTEKEDNQK